MSGSDELRGNQRAVQEIARIVLQLDPPARLPSAQELQRSLQVGAGTVQRAFGLLEDMSAVRTRSHGHQGRHIVQRDLGLLWSMANLEPVRAVLTPPGALEVYGLSDALEAEFARIRIPLEIRYVRGAHARLESLGGEQTSFAVLSAGAAHAYHAESNDYTTSVLGDGTYYAPGSVIELTRPGADPVDPEVRIGVDGGSFDHETLTRAQFGELDHRRTVDVAFTYAPAALLNGQIDIAIWHRMLLMITPTMAGLLERPLTDRAVDALQPLSRAVLVGPSTDPYLDAVLGALSPVRLEELQRTAMATMALDDQAAWCR